MNNRAGFTPWRALWVTSLGTFMATLDGSIVNVALPTIGHAFQAPLPHVQWVVTAYLLTISSLLLFFGRLGDIIGRRRVYSWAFLVFTAASGLCGMATSVSTLVAARVLQGIGGAMLMANSSGLVMTAFPGSNRGRALGVVGMVVGLGSMAGPALGGFLVDSLGWRSVFYVNIPFGLAAFALAGRFLPADEPLPGQSLDFVGAALFALSMALLLTGIIHGNDWGWDSPWVLSCLGVSLLCMAAFILYEKRIESPLFDFSLLGNPLFLTGIISACLTFMAQLTNILLMPFYLHTVLAMTPARTGLVLAVLPLSMAALAPLSGYLSERMNHAALSSAGLAVIIAGLVHNALLGLTPGNWRPVLGQFLLGVGFGLFQSPNNNSILSNAPRDSLGLAGGVLALLRNLGMVFGVAMAVTVYEAFRLPGPATSPEAFYPGFRAALLAGALLSVGNIMLSLSRRAGLAQRPSVSDPWLDA